jgi:hypothetical protein
MKGLHVHGSHFLKEKKSLSGVNMVGMTIHMKGLNHSNS